MKTIRTLLFIALLLSVAVIYQTKAWMLIPVMIIITLVIISIELFLYHDRKGKSDKTTSPPYNHDAEKISDAIGVHPNALNKKIRDLLKGIDSDHKGLSASRISEVIELSDMTRRELAASNALLLKDKIGAGCGDPNCKACGSRAQKYPADMPPFIKEMLEKLNDIPGVQSVVVQKGEKDKPIPPVTGPAGEA